MYELENILEILENLVNTKRKRHLTGGILISLAALFGGLAATALTIGKTEERNDDEDEY